MAPFTFEGAVLPEIGRDVREPIGFEDLFWSQVDMDGDCWEWLGHRQRDGYGTVKYDRETERAHRVAWILARGIIPPGLHVLHRCDNPPCVNPDHLWLGTHLENMRDRDSKNRRRAPVGELNPRAKLTWDDVAYIRSSSEPASRIAARLGLSATCVRDARRGRRWSLDERRCELMRQEPSDG